MNGVGHGGEWPLRVSCLPSNVCILCLICWILRVARPPYIAEGEISETPVTKLSYVGEFMRPKGGVSLCIDCILEYNGVNQGNGSNVTTAYLVAVLKREIC